VVWGLTNNIGHPKLFIVGEDVQRNISPQTTVTTFRDSERLMLGKILVLPGLFNNA
jgi:hypothetical protein